jgi:hypothetical protein
MKPPDLHVPANDESQDRRRDPRLSCDSTVVALHLDASDEPLAANLIEVSRAGLKLQAAEALPVGSLITIDVGEITVLGEVRRCDPGPGDSYTVGLLTHDVRE